MPPPISGVNEQAKKETSMLPGGDMFLQNDSGFQIDYIAWYHRRRNSQIGIEQSVVCSHEV
jgi:hypothetical protein